MRLINNYYCCPQAWTLTQILAHMDLHCIETIAVLIGENGSELVGVIEKSNLKNVIAELSLDASQITAHQIFDTIRVKKI
ncbi:MAG: hypothetical protein WCI57_05280 [Candidatus Berkelbacteria bacterium]